MVRKMGSIGLPQVDFHEGAAKGAADKRLRAAVVNNTFRKQEAREQRWAELPDIQALRSLGAQIKQHTLDNLDFYLDQLKTNVERNGGHVHFAKDGAAARQIIFDIIAKTKSKKIIKSKSMASEEIELTHELEKAKLDVVETDLGEFIVQVSHDRPSHLVAPIIHKDRKSIGTVLTKFLGIPYTDDPPTLTQQARLYLRNKFRNADLGMTGGNFLVAETGKVCVVENEGNARQSLTTPRVLVSLVGIEKLVPRMSDLAVMIKLLARSSTGQSMTVYTNIFGAPRRQGEKDGPEEFHLVLLDNGRTEILADPEYREVLRCIRCGACLNICPIFRSIGGHAYGSVYPGPIGALLSPLLGGLQNYADLPQASSLCGACYQACPVKIDIPKHLISLRRDISKRHINGFFERLLYRLWARGMRSLWLYKKIGAIQRWDLRRRATETGWVRKLPGPASGWTQVRDLPAPAQKSFHQLWEERKPS
jgi:L-lactate dehydrogenase complex protein LldF